MERKVHKQNTLSLTTKTKLFQAVNKGNCSKTKICKKFGIPNSTLSTIIKTEIKLHKINKTSKLHFVYGSNKQGSKMLLSMVHY
jgi:hypothetical protein